LRNFALLNSVHFICSVILLINVQMGISERKEREKEAMRDTILEAAKKLFLDKGFEKTSIRNIADEIEYSPGTIYLYFRDKNELLLHLHYQAFNVMVSEFLAAPPQEDPMDQLIQMGHQYIKFALENPEMYNLMFVMDAPMEALECNNEIWNDGMEAFGMLQNLVGVCINAGYFKGHNVDDLSLGIWSFMHGLVILKSKKRMSMFKDNEEESSERMMRAFETFTTMLKAI
jgi:AcrR family transcriptional regulator